jgi:chromosome segregation ATPase
MTTQHPTPQVTEEHRRKAIENICTEYGCLWDDLVTSVRVNEMRATDVLQDLASTEEELLATQDALEKAQTELEITKSMVRAQSMVERPLHERIVELESLLQKAEQERDAAIAEIGKQARIAGAAESALSAMKERIREIAVECVAFPASAIKWRLMKAVESALTSSSSGERAGNDAD